MSALRMTQHRSSDANTMPSVCMSRCRMDAQKNPGDVHDTTHSPAHGVHAMRATSSPAGPGSDAGSGAVPASSRSKQSPIRRPSHSPADGRYGVRVAFSVTLLIAVYARTAMKYVAPAAGLSMVQLSLFPLRYGRQV